MNRFQVLIILAYFFIAFGQISSSLFDFNTHIRGVRPDIRKFQESQISYKVNEILLIKNGDLLMVFSLRCGHTSKNWSIKGRFRSVQLYGRLKIATICCYVLCDELGKAYLGA